jgi:hypothetical protein
MEINWIHDSVCGFTGGWIGNEPYFHIEEIYGANKTMAYKLTTLGDIKMEKFFWSIDEAKEFCEKELHIIIRISGE